ncbi:MAG: carbohydrate ABC transporter substrate-binding protein, partial [Micromonosporaceae bacterium]|nr:carbohydrate ABC transporter substrate-binding protein [Micromonosporaceae bacterium]
MDGRQYRRGLIAAAAAIGVLVSMSACADDPVIDGDSGEQITLVVDVYGKFGYEDLYKRYMQLHPNIKITERGTDTDLSDYNEQMAKWIASGSGAGDIVALEESTIVQFKSSPERFVNLYDHSAGSLEQNFLSWKWKQGQTADGKYLMGLGTDVGSMAICYRKDLFARAGLPTDREKVAELWPTWQDFIATGKKFAAAERKAKFVDAATNFFNTVVMQIASNSSGYTYFDTYNKLALETNQDVRTAWDLTTQMIELDLSAGFPSFTDEWKAGLKQSQFATVGCPAWVTGIIAGEAGAGQAGKWDVARAPGGGGNWGGSFLTVPKQSKHQKEAVALAKYLTDVEAQISVFSKVGNLPSNPRALQDPLIVSLKNEYFSNAPTGEIFAAGATSLSPCYFGPNNAAVRTEVENALHSIETGKRTADEAWQDALAKGKAA